MEATKELNQEKEKSQNQEYQEPPQTQSFRNKVPNTFEELNAIRANQNPYPNTINSFIETHSSFAQHGNNILQSSSYKSKEDC